MLPLDNGYTVGLRIAKVDEKIFKVRFRCVKTRVSENERAVAGDGP